MEDNTVKSNESSQFPLTKRLCINFSKLKPSNYYVSYIAAVAIQTGVDLGFPEGRG